MANFKQHVTIGAFAGYFVAVGSYFIDWVNDFALAVLIFFATVIGSFLPDMDSNSGLPLQIIFGVYAFIGAGLAMYLPYAHHWHWAFIIALPIATFVLIHWVLRRLFAKYTKHRGIFHSTPAVIIAFCLSLIITDTLKLSILEKFSFSIAISLGYLSHLILDEVYSTGITEGKIKMKKSFGTALDLGFKPRREGIIAYTILAVCVYFAYPIMKMVIQKLTF